MIISIIGNGFALDALEHYIALAIGVQQVDLRHNVDVLIVGRLGKEGAEFVGEVAVADDQRLAVLGVSGLCKCGARYEHAQHKQHGEKFLHCSISSHS